MKTNYTELIKYHNNFLYLYENDSTIQNFIKNQSLVIKKHNIYLKHIRTKFSSLNLYEKFLIKYENEKITMSLLNSKEIYNNLEIMYKNTEAFDIFYTFQNKLLELLLMHESVEIELTIPNIC